MPQEFYVTRASPFKRERVLNAFICALWQEERKIILLSLTLYHCFSKRVRYYIKKTEKLVICYWIATDLLKRVCKWEEKTEKSKSSMKSLKYWIGVRCFIWQWSSREKYPIDGDEQMFYNEQNRTFVWGKKSWMMNINISYWI